MDEHAGGAKFCGTGGFVSRFWQEDERGWRDAMKERRRASMGGAWAGAGDAGLRSFDNNLDRAAPICYRSNLRRC